MSGSEADREPDKQTRRDGAAPELGDEVRRRREPESSEDEESEDNDGGPPSTRRH